MGSISAPVPASLQKSLETTKVEYRRLGKSGLQVSVPILGGMGLGSKQWQPWVIEEDEALELLKAAYDRGVNTWDTANVYSSGVSEELFGKALQKFEIPRHKVVFLTKISMTVGEEPSVSGMWHPQVKVARDYVNQGGLSRAAIFNQVEASLKRLRTSYIDLLQIHRFDDETPIEETMGALNDLVRSGKVRYIGASSMYTYQFAQMQFVAERNGWAKFISMQNHYSLLYREEEREMNKFCKDTGVGLIPWSPLARGHLTRPSAAGANSTRSVIEKQYYPQLADHLSAGAGVVDVKIVDRVEEIAKKHGWTMSQVALAWISKRVASPIIGFSSVSRMEEAIGMRGKELSEEETKYLEELYLPKSIIGH